MWINILIHVSLFPNNYWADQQSDYSHLALDSEKLRRYFYNYMHLLSKYFWYLDLEKIEIIGYYICG